MIKAYTFDVELIFEPSFDAMMVHVDYECEDPESIILGNIPADFIEYVLQNISIVAHEYGEV
jgi:hypothetical protein